MTRRLLLYALLLVVGCIPACALHDSLLPLRPLLRVDFSIPPQVYAVDTNHGQPVKEAVISIFVEEALCSGCSVNLSVNDTRYLMGQSADNVWTFRAPFGIGRHDFVIELVAPDGSVVLTQERWFTVYPLPRKEGSIDL